MQQSTVEEALDVLRPGLSSDGFDLRIGSIGDDGAVQVVLEAKPDACLDCLVPEDLMLQIIEQAIRERDESLTGVELLKVGFEGLAEH